MIDEDNFERLSQYNYCLNSGYVSRRESGNANHIYLHHDVIGFPPASDLVTNHLDRDKLNNTRINLEHTTVSGNAQNVRRKRNTSGYHGVSFDKRQGQWKAGINVHGRAKHLGYFDDIVEAAKTYDQAAVKQHGRNALTNFNF